jgi:hypothetical protein
MSESCYIEPNFATKKMSTKTKRKFANPDDDIESGEPAPKKKESKFDNKMIIISLAVIIVILICLIVWLMYRDEPVKIPEKSATPAPKAKPPPKAAAPAPVQVPPPEAPAPIQPPAIAPPVAHPPPAKQPIQPNHAQIVKTSTDEELKKVIDAGEQSEEVSDVEPL